ncbi:MAG: hypothetical protein K9J30_05425 [Bacteroidales bacterium]|nr:hypothetical protein [Bacteroidales bacterium]
MRIEISLILCLFVFLSGHGQASPEVNEESFFKIYELARERTGDNPLLKNGIYYENLYLNAKGNPFFVADKFFQGSVTYRNTLYEDVMLKYDIFNQDLIIRHDEENVVTQSILSHEFVSEFTINGLIFKNLSMDPSEKGYYQLVADDSHLSCFYFWYKSRNESHEGKYKIYVFSDNQKRKYLQIENQLFIYRNNRNFVRSFPEASRSRIKNYLKNNRINVRKADDSQMQELIGFCDPLIH